MPKRKNVTSFAPWIPGGGQRERTQFLMEVLNLKERRAYAYLQRECPFTVDQARQMEQATGVNRCFWAWPDEYDARGRLI